MYVLYVSVILDHLQEETIRGCRPYFTDNMSMLQNLYRPNEICLKVEQVHTKVVSLFVSLFIYMNFSKF
jgi:hypothetical protein